MRGIELLPSRRVVARWVLAGLSLIGGGDYLRAQNTLTLSSGTAIDSGTVSLGLSLSVSGTAPAGLQFTLAFPANQIAAVSVLAGPAANAANKTVLCAPASGQFTCLITGLNTKAIGAGAVANVQLTLTSTATTTLITMSNLLGVDASANGLSVGSSGPALITVPTVSGITCTPASLSPGGTAACNVTLTSGAPALGAPVAISSTNPLLAAPATVGVPGGATTASFNVTAATVIPNNQNVSVSASLDGAAKSTTVTLQSATTPPLPTLTVAPSTLQFVTALNHATSQTISLTNSIAGADFTATPVTANGGNWLSVSPGSGAIAGAQTTFTVNVNSTGLSPGPYTGIINFSTDSGASATVAVAMNVSAAGQLTVSPSALSFTYNSTGANAPPAQGLSIFTNPTGTAFTAVPGQGAASWLSVGGGTTGAAPASLPISVHPANLALGTYSSQIVVSSSVADPVQIPVTLMVQGGSPQLSVSTAAQSFALLEGTNPLSGQIVVQNAGGGVLQFTAQAVSSQANWLSLNGSTSGSATSQAPATLGFTLNPTGLAAGLYSGQITVQDTASSTQAVVPILMALTHASQTVTTSQSGLTFNTVQNGPLPPAQSFFVNTLGSAAPDWTAQGHLLSDSQSVQNSWLNISPTSSNGSADSIVTVTVNQAGLSPGRYYGSIEIDSPTADDAPQEASVLLDVFPASPGIQISSGGLIFSGEVGSETPQQQQISLFNPLNTPVSWSAVVFSPDAQGWLSVFPSSGTLMPGANTIGIQANFDTLLSPGLFSGTVSLAFGDGSSGAVQVEAASMAGTVAQQTAATSNIVGGCLGGQPSFLLPVIQQPVDYSILETAIAQTVRVYAVDDCGNTLKQTNGSAVQVTFSNGDTPLNLKDTGAGLWEATWIPQNPGDQVSLQATAFRANALLNSVGPVITTSVEPAAGGAPQITGVVNAATSAQGTPQVVAPGSYISIYGTNLSSTGAGSASTVPLPSSLNGVELFLGGQPLPLLYASPTQLTALVPQELNVNTDYELTVLRGSVQSVPVPLLLTGLQPGIYTVNFSGSGQGVVEIAGTTLLSAPASETSRPVQSGAESLIVYCTGLGPVVGANGEAPPANGAAAPAGILYRTTAQVTATIGGVSVPVTFSGLTPTLVGLYQVNIQVPAGVPTGDAVPLLIDALDPATEISVQSNAVTIAIR